ncbi:MAG: glycosyltransferase family 2 protein [Lachnospiraceae bacterium]|nr:glycosyltransferase family 2 protein [Lachnospiraceae bacterium]
MITISLCMIVKNEEKVLERCLTSIADLMDEIIIVDTGSTDRTKEIAKGFTDKVYDFTWTGSFSDARNFSFSKATMEYIYCADADEVLEEENRNRFRLLKQSLLPEIDIVQMLYCNQLSYNTIYNYDREYRPKLYKRLRTFTWEGAIHEAVRLEPVIYDSDVEILHMPLGEHTSRDLKAFEAMAKNGVRFDKRLHNIYAKELFISGSEEDFIRALPAFLNTLADTTRTEDEIMEACCVVAKAYRLQHDTESFFKYALKNVAGNVCSEICYELGKHYESLSDYEEAVIWYYNAAYETKSILNIRLSGDLPLLAIAGCYEKLGLMEEAEAYRKAGKDWTYQASASSSEKE